MTAPAVGGGPLEIRHPARWVPERRYVASVVLGTWLGFEVQFIEQDRADTEISRPGAPGTIAIAEGSFALAEGQRLRAGSVPRPPFPRWRVTDPSLRARVTSDWLPVVGVRDGVEPIVVTPGRVEIGFDLFGWSFLSLTRYEEAVGDERDPHGRFPLSASAAYKGGFHQRPLVDEYANVLAWALEAAGVGRRPRPRPDGYRVALTHDVDRPVAALEDGVRGLARRTAADLIVRRDPGLAVRRLAAFPGAKRAGFSRDPNYTFELLMDIAEAAGQTALFNILARTRVEPGPEPASPMDAAYRLTDPPVSTLLRRVRERGHRIGLHGSYNSYASAEQMVLEMGNLRHALDDLGIGSDRLPARQHYLRWAAPDTWRHLEQAGALFDSTLGYAEAPGFRCGTCRPFPVFDLETRTALSLWEHPLIVMDVALQPGSLQRGPIDDVLRQVDGVVSMCKGIGGEFVVLWHNNNAIGRRGETLYREIVRLACGGVS